MIIEGLTNNPSRTAPDLRSILEKNGGNLATRGAVSFQFTKQGVITIKSDAIDEEKLMELALESGAEDVKNEGEVYEVLTTPTSYLKVKEALETAKVAVEAGGNHEHAEQHRAGGSRDGDICRAPAPNKTSDSFKYQ